MLRCSPWAPEGFESKKKRGKHGPVLLGGVIGVSTHQLPRGAGDAWLAPSTHFALRTDRGAQHRVPVPPPKDAGGEWDAGGGHGGGDGAVGSAPHPPYLLGHLCFPAGPANPAETRQDQTPRAPSLGGDVPAGCWPRTQHPPTPFWGGFPLLTACPRCPGGPGRPGCPALPCGEEEDVTTTAQTGAPWWDTRSPVLDPTRARNPSHSPFPVFPVVIYWEEEEQRVLVPPQPPRSPSPSRRGCPGCRPCHRCLGDPTKRGRGDLV